MFCVSDLLMIRIKKLTIEDDNPVGANQIGAQRAGLGGDQQEAIPAKMKKW
jgi:hypothetical protein